MTRDLTLESLPEGERETAERYARRFSDSFVYYDPTLSGDAALEDGRDFVSQVWIRMGPQADRAEAFKK